MFPKKLADTVADALCSERWKRPAKFTGKNEERHELDINPVVMHSARPADL